MASNVVLRIGVIRRGAVVEERLVDARGPVSFGTAPGNTFVLDAPDAPRSIALFDRRGEAQVLGFTDAQSGTIARADGRSETLRALASSSERVDGSFVVPLDAKSRGRIQLGVDTTILFHFVSADVVRASAGEAQRARGVVGQVEPVFTAVLLASFLVHAALGLVAVVAAPPQAPAIDELRRLVADIAPPMPPAPRIDVTKHVPITPRVTSAQHGDAIVADAASTKHNGTGAGSRTETRATFDDVGILQLIGGHGEGASADPLGRVFAARPGVSDDIARALDGTSAIDVARAANAAVIRRGDDEERGSGAAPDGPRGAADIGVFSAKRHGDVDVGTKQAAHVVARVHTDDVEAVDGGTVDKKSVASILMRRHDGFRNCYEESLKASTKLQGKLVVEITIGDGGRVNDARVVNDGLGSAEVSRCVIGLLKRVRFPAPSGGEVTISDTFVFQPGG